ncbi:MAG: T9SS type A sorting domain-containing protein, partial [Ignavibacterium sp.]|nr:T9SS type A sorting domain-containing protein [Ignavibacterium sp.]
FSLGNGSASIEFYAGYSTSWLTGATLKLHISTDGGSNWTQLWTADNDGQGWIWRNKVIDLTSYSNKQNLKLAWQYVGIDGDLAGIDGVKLMGHTTTGIDDNSNKVVTDYSLSQNYPNPFNPATMISWQAPVSGHQTLKVYDLLGREVATLVDEFKTAGVYSIKFNAENLASGVYIYTLKVSDFISSRKMILLK